MMKKLLHYCLNLILLFLCVFCCSLLSDMIMYVLPDILSSTLEVGSSYRAYLSYHSFETVIAILLIFIVCVPFLFGVKRIFSLKIPSVIYYPIGMLLIAAIAYIIVVRYNYMNFSGKRLFFGYISYVLPFYLFFRFVSGKIKYQGNMKGANN
jgi:hypothetical protein